METEDKYNDYLQQRKQLIAETRDPIFKDLNFSQDEQIAIDIWEKMLQAERYQKKHTFYHTFTLRHKNEYENTEVFKTIAKMPKGSTLHIHLDCCMDIEWFLSEHVFRGDIYFNQELSQFNAFKTEELVTEGFINTNTIAEKMGKDKALQMFRQRLQVTQQEAENFDADIWNAFESKIMCGSNLIHNTLFSRTYLERVFRNFIKDGVTRLEARTFIGFTVDDNREPVPAEVEFKEFEEVVAEVQKDHPEFSLGLVLQGLKVWDNKTIDEYYRRAFELKKKFPKLITSFDMVQEEDKYRNMEDFAKVFVKKQELEKEYGVEMPFCFHGGESLDTQLNQNMYDMILLDSKRVGHGLNLSQHSHLIDKIKEKGICLELCPLSNQVLRYYNDIRVHPCKAFINNGVKVTISPDDPGIFGVNGVNHDFYGITMGNRLGLKELKLLIHNSVYCSFITQEEKDNLWNFTEGKWNDFIRWFLESYNKDSYLKTLDAIIGDNSHNQFQ